MRLRDMRRTKWFDTVYKIGIGIKGFDGAVELVAGILLAFAPHTPHRLLLRAADEAREHNGTLFHLFEKTVIHLDAQLTGGVLIFIIIFLIIHGLVKLILVYALFKKIYRAYPYGLALLIILLIVQVIPLFSHPGALDLWIFTVLDIFIIYLVWAEYQDLREEVAALEAKGVPDEEAKKMV